jgi:hypothetical protein
MKGSYSLVMKRALVGLGGTEAQDERVDAVDGGVVVMSDVRWCEVENN